MNIFRTRTAALLAAVVLTFSAATNPSHNDTKVTLTERVRSTNVGVSTSAV